MRRAISSSIRTATFCFITLIFGACNKPHLDKGVWNGIWRLNTDKSHLSAKSFSIGIERDGNIEITNGAGSIRLKCDGTGYSNGANHWTSCEALNPKQWRMVGKTRGQSDTVSLWTLDGDEKSLSIDTVTPSQNQDKAKQKRFDRISGNSGFGGRWVDADPFSGAVHILSLSVDGKTMHIAYPELHEYADVPFYGTADVKGTKSGATTQLSVAPKNPLEVAISVSERGAVVRTGIMKIVGDGKVLVKQSWFPQAPNETETLVFER